MGDGLVLGAFDTFGLIWGNYYFWERERNTQKRREAEMWVADHDSDGLVVGFQDLGRNQSRGLEQELFDQRWNPVAFRRHERFQLPKCHTPLEIPIEIASNLIQPPRW